MIAPSNPRASVKVNSSVMRSKLEHFMNQKGTANLCILTDFDYTLTRYSLHKEGLVKLAGTFGCIRESKFTDEEYRAKSNSLYNQYHKYEMDHSLTPEFRRKKIREWWKQDLEQIVNLGLSRDNFLELVKESNLQLRYGIDRVLEVCSELNVPMIVVSAGFSSIVQASFDLLFNELNSPTINKDLIYVVANESEFNDEHKLIGFTDPVVHSMNKDRVM
mmetsp:Transcript_41554/g.39961  ORF Transcript_41554/g.39961 Transcript_41554/m.39961 type:complete len:218 (+) Transcript_41554:168-821(+)|eukprot:CAMPEP_0170540318 /NCGR_PEP_ID=MMETSP0211-20121228/333_1 /TAXON_ID=311385 /ORGANISM="Pseudokeronopsis sp., Strain OXSARD2" /LENGTH=217 /DNA_ID=CAMNT_0010842673 /DNA_START=103 /DNA_END=756 /DNA_ORIENTATION=-